MLAKVVQVDLAPHLETHSDKTANVQSSSVHQRRARPPRREEISGVIIGAGLSGLRFGQLIREHYPSVKLTVIDRLGRTGGRVYTSRSRPGQDGFELGAEFVNQDHDSVRKLCGDFGIDLVPTYHSPREAPKMGYFEQGHFREAYRKEFKIFINAISQDRACVEKDPALKNNFDKLSVRKYLDQLEIKGDGREILELFLETEQGISPSQMSVSFLLEFMDFEKIKPEHHSFLAPGDDRFVINGGSSSLVTALERTLEESDSLKLGKLVEAVTISPAGRFRVFAGDKAPYECDFVVFAIPGPAYKNIRIFSGLKGMDDLKRKLLGLRYSESEKTIIEVSGPPLPVLNEYNQILVEEARGMVWLSGRWRGAERQTSHIAIYRGGSNVGRHNYNKAFERVVSGLTIASRKLTHRGIDTPRIIDGVTEHWPDGGFSQPKLGSGANFTRGTTLRMGHVFVIGEQMASKDPQTMEGALESAERAFEACALEIFGEKRTVNPPTKSPG